MCFFTNSYIKNIHAPRFVWKGGLGDNPPPTGGWDEPDVRGARQKEINAGKGRRIAPFELPAQGPDKPKTIDPGPVVIDPRTGKPMEKLEDRFPALKEVVKKLQDIGNEQFWNKNPQALSGDHLAEFIKMAEKMPESMLYQAIVENWSEETLYKKYEQVMGDLYTRTASRPWMAEAWGQAKRGWHAAFKSENLGEPGMNLAIEGKRKISLRERPKVIAKMLKLETELLNGDDVCLEWDGECDDWEDRDDVDEERLEFIQDEMIAFYRNWFLNKGILEDRTADDVTWAYAKALADFVNSCVKP